MKVWRAFREFCREHVLLTKNMILEPCEAKKSFENLRKLDHGWTLRDIESDTTSNVDFVWPGVDCQENWKERRTDYGFIMREEPSWLVSIGVESHKRSMLKGVEFKLRRLAQ